MDIHDKFSKVSRLTDKKDLVEYIEKRFTTSFIGSLASIEEHLKELFTPDDWEYYWPPLREEILNKANAQKRLSVKELEKYEHRKMSKTEKESENYTVEKNRVNFHREDENYNR